ncbi:hypothetical protein Tco_0343159 [Tanacetum coccineum]
MSSDNTSSAVTYTSISSDSDGPLWGIPLVNVGELSKMDPYEEVSEQGQAPPLSPAYVPDPMKLDEHVPVYVSEPEHPEYHVPSDDDMQVEDQPYADDASPIAKSPGYITDSNSIEEDSIDYPDEPEDDDEDPEEDPSEEHKPEDKDTREEEPSEGSDETKPFEEEETTVTPPPPSRHRGARISGLIRSPGHDAWTIARATDKAEDVGYVRALQASKHRMMTFIEEVNLRVSYQTDRRDIRLKIDVVRCQRTAYETELHEVRQAYLSSEARNRALLARLETLETHMSRME